MVLKGSVNFGPRGSTALGFGGHAHRAFPVVPDAFFKAILAGERSIAFVMYNHNNNENLQKCAMSVDDLEVLTGIDFFEELDDALENQVEATYSVSVWM